MGGGSEAEHAAVIVPNRPECAADVREFVMERLRGVAPEQQAHLVTLAVDEAVTNAMEHGYGRGVEGEIDVHLEVSPGHVRVCVRDRGRDFDPLGVALPDVAAHVRAGKARGLGLLLMRRIMDRVSHARVGDTNELTMEKRFACTC